MMRAIAAVHIRGDAGTLATGGAGVIGYHFAGLAWLIEVWSNRSGRRENGHSARGGGGEMRTCTFQAMGSDASSGYS